MIDWKKGLQVICTLQARACQFLTMYFQCCDGAAQYHRPDLLASVPTGNQLSVPPDYCASRPPMGGGVRSGGVLAMMQAPRTCAAIRAWEEPGPA